MIPLTKRKAIYIIFGAIPAGLFFIGSALLATASLDALVSGQLEEWGGYGISTIFAFWGACIGYIVGIWVIINLPYPSLQIAQRIQMVLIATGAVSLIWLYKEFGLDSLGVYLRLMMSSPVIVSILLIIELWNSPNKALKRTPKGAA